MKIKSQKHNYFNNNSLLIFFKKYRFLKLMIFFFFFIVFSLLLISWGMHLYKFKTAESLNELRYSIKNKTAFISNSFKGFSAKPKTIKVDIKFKYVQRIDYLRDISIKRGFIYSDVKQEKFPAVITFNGEKYKVKLSMTGQNLDHLVHSRISYRVNVKNDKTIMGMKEFALLMPKTRGYLSEWIVHMFQKQEDLISLRYDFVDVTINGQNKGIYCIEEHFGKFLIENNQYREGIIFKPGLQGIDVYNKKKIESNPTLNSQLVMLENLWQSFINDDIPAEKLFNIEKLSKDFAITDLVNGHHSKYLGNSRYYFNPINSMIEPISREFGSLNYSDVWRGTKNTDLFINCFENYGSLYYKKIFKSDIFFKSYIKELHRISQAEYLNSFFSSIKSQMNKKLCLIYKDNPFYSYPKEFLYDNQKTIEEKLNPNIDLLQANFDKIADGIVIDFKNKHFLPIEIKYIASNDSIIFKSSQLIVIPSNKIVQNEYFQYKFFPENNITINKDIKNNLYVFYSILGLDEIKKCKVFPYSSDNANTYNHNPTTNSIDFSKLEFVNTDEKNRIIYIKKGMYSLDKKYIIKPAYTVVAEEGLKIDLLNGASLISYSPLNFHGSDENPIVLTSSDSTGQGIFVLNTKENSVLDYVQFNNLSNPSKNGWELSGAITFYEADVSISNCIFSNNQRGDDFLNIVRSEFDINNTLFSNILSDAFDSDFCTGTISNSSFENCGNDAIDVSGTSLRINNVFMNKIGDKGLSSGENSQMIADNVTISNSEIAICSKDLSQIKVSDVHLKNNKIGFTAFQKKSEFGPGNIEGSRVEMENISIPYLIEIYSKCTIDGKTKTSNNDSVKDLLYGVKYGKSSK